MTVDDTEYELTAEATWLESEAQALAASLGHETFTSQHLLFAALRSDTTFGSALHTVGVGAKRRRLEDDLGVGSTVSHRLPRDYVQRSHDLVHVYDAAQRRARSDGRRDIDAEDLVWALCSVTGPHTRFLYGKEPRVHAAFSTAEIEHGNAGDATSARENIVIHASRTVWSLWTWLLGGFAAGGMLLVAGGGIILYRAGSFAFAMLGRYQVGFTDTLSQVGGVANSSRALSVREMVRQTLLLRVALGVVSILIFSFVVFESIGVGLVPWPALARDPATAVGGLRQADSNIVALIFSGRNAIQVWTALGAAFLSIPPFAELDRLTHALDGGSRRERRLRRLLLPIRALARPFAFLDRTTSGLGLPNLLATGVLGLATCLLIGASLAHGLLWLVG